MDQSWKKFSFEEEKMWNEAYNFCIVQFRAYDLLKESVSYIQIHSLKDPFKCL